jgi:hypothetical protein
MIKKPLAIILLAGLFCLFVVGVCNACITLIPIYLALKPDSDRHCTPPPHTFSEADLIGTWEAGVPTQRDILEIREDGTYRQEIHIEFTTLPTVDYESAWQQWWFEERENGIPYLHLEGFRLCAFNPGISCEQIGGGGHDFCRNAQVVMHNEGILLVLGAPKPLIRFPGETYAPRGFYLAFPAGSENSWSYDLKEP